MMMNIGLISDIHADLDGFEQALKVLRQREVDVVLCAGDLVDRGGDGDAVVAKVRDLAIPTVQGNHDYFAKANQRVIRYMPNHSPLKPHTLDYLTKLPRTLTDTFAGRALTVAHATPWDLIMPIDPQSTPALFKRVLRAAGAPVVVLGHTHLPMVVTVENLGLIVNPGSTYSNYYSDRYTGMARRSCAIIEMPHGNVTHYDIQQNTIMPAPHITIE